MDSQKYVPKLRFAEFRDQWISRKLGEIGTFKNGINKSKEDFGFGFPFVNLMDVFGKSTLTETKFDLVNASKDELDTYDLKKGDVLFIRSSVKKSGVGETSLLLNDLVDTVYSGFLIRFRDDKTKLNVDFKRYCFSNRKFRNSLISLSTTSANTNINQESLSSLSIALPSEAEQQKISSFMSLVDKWINSLMLQKESLKSYKKGVMQKIFSQEIRFKDENEKDFPSWESTTLGDIYKDSSERKGNKELDLLSVTTNNGVTKQSSSNKRDSSSLDKSNYKVVHAMDLVYNTMRMWQGAFGVSDYDGFVSPAYTVVKLISGVSDFYKYILKQPRVVFDFYRYSQGLTSDTWNLKFNNFSKIIVNVPSDTREQQKIADFLTSIDNIIESKSDQIAQAETWKKGLMQQMFI